MKAQESPPEWVKCNKLVHLYKNVHHRLEKLVFRHVHKKKNVSKTMILNNLKTFITKNFSN